jgi:hypothetical protein
MKIVAVIVLSIVFLIVVWNSIVTINKKRAVYARSRTTAVIAHAAREGMVFGGKTMQKIKDEKALEWGRDPFQRYEIATEKVEDASRLRLMGITTGAKGKSIAVLNNEMVRAGSRIGKFQVISIEKDSVVVTDGKQKYTLKMQ